MLTQFKAVFIIVSVMIIGSAHASEFDDELLRLVNLEREKVGLSALRNETLIIPETSSRKARLFYNLATNLRPDIMQN